MVAKTLSIKKDGTLTKEHVMGIIIDVTEIPTQRPCKKQREKYSGKKKRHTLKSEIGMTKDGKIRHVLKVHGGVHTHKKINYINGSSPTINRGSPSAESAMGG